MIDHFQKLVMQKNFAFQATSRKRYLKFSPTGRYFYE